MHGEVTLHRNKKEKYERVLFRLMQLYSSAHVSHILTTVTLKPIVDCRELPKQS